MLNKNVVKGIIVALFWLSQNVNAASPEPNEVQPKPLSDAEKPYQNTQTYTLKELGARFPFSVVGVDGRNSVGLSIREDQIVTNASLDVHYSYSPKLSPERSSLSILLNDEPIGTLPITKENGGQLLSQTLNVPAWMFVNYNQLGVKLAANNNGGCEERLHENTWARLTEKTTISITTQPLKIASNLALLPLPFFSQHDNHKVNLPFIFADVPSNGEIEAAGYVASWLGQLSGYRGAAFSVKINQIPERGHAIVFTTSAHALPLHELPEIHGGGLAIINNPNDVYGKLLVIYGRTNDELKQAARALLLSRKSFTGSFVEVDSVALPAPREPYDAPFWVQKDRPFRFGEIVDKNLLAVDDVQNVVRIPLRLPPDLFFRNSKGVPVYLKYRYTPRRQDDKSVLNISLNDDFLTSEPLHSSDKLNSKQEKVMDLVLGNKQAYSEKTIYLASNQLSPVSELKLHFQFDRAKQVNCQEPSDSINDKAVIDADSSIDITKAKHFIHMPNLAAFANSGYPFTRLADLAETAIVLPDAPDTDTLEGYLQLMARMGESTGFPAIRLSVIKKSEMVNGLDKDILVLEKQTGAGSWEKWKHLLPLQFRQEQEGIIQKLNRLWDAVFADDTQVDDSASKLSQYNQNGFIAGFESPFKTGRSLVLVAANDNVSFGRMLDIMLSSDKGLADVQGSVVVVDEDKVRTVSSKTTYTLGSIGLWEGWLLYLSLHPFISDLIVVLTALLISLMLTVVLNAKVKRRLQGLAK